MELLAQRIGDAGVQRPRRGRANCLPRFMYWSHVRNSGCNYLEVYMLCTGLFN